MKKIIKKSLRLVFLCIAFILTNKAYAVEEWHKEHVTAIIHAFSNNDIEAISSLIEYPLYRQTPVPAIESKEEMIKLFNVIFDDGLINDVSNSSFDDWHSMGTKGIMLDDGTIWLNSSGKIIAVNYQSQVEIKLNAKIVKSIKTQVHKSLKSFDRPVLLWRTKKFLVRVDYLGDDIYRYASWSLPAKYSDKPDLILTGTSEVYGTAGNHEYVFKIGAYEYKCVINNVGPPDALPMALEVYKKDALILTQAVITEEY